MGNGWFLIFGLVSFLAVTIPFGCAVAWQFGLVDHVRKVTISNEKALLRWSLLASFLLVATVLGLAIAFTFQPK